MTEIQISRKYDLEERTYEFARDIRSFVKKLPSFISNREDAKQVVRSSGSVGANYIEANESLGKKDFLMRIKICRKEAKETHYWLRLIATDNNLELDMLRMRLMTEATELLKIFSAIAIKSQTSPAYKKTGSHVRA